MVIKSANPSESTAAMCLKEWEGRKLPLAPGMGPPTSASSVGAMEKRGKKQKRRINICLMVSE